MATIQDYIRLISEGQTLSQPEATEAFEILMSGQAEPAQIGGFLMALRMRGETVDEITGAATVMRAKAVGVQAPEGAIDNCGTGGDASGTYNISTACAFVVAGAGVPVAKHGNKSVSSKSGSADVLSALGVNLDVTPQTVARSIEHAGIGFMFAPAHHAAMKHVGPARVALGVRTIFNILGPLANPAGTKRQVIGVFSKDWLEPLAQVLNKLGTQKVWIVHGSDGLDELTTTGQTFVCALDEGQISHFSVNPQDVGLPLATPDMLKGGDAAQNAQAIKHVLEGEQGAFRDIVLLNAGACLVVSGRTGDLQEGVQLAAQSIDQGKANEALAKLMAVTNNQA